MAIKIHLQTQPDALIKVFQEQPERILLIDNADENGQLAPLTLPDNQEYTIAVTLFSDNK